MQMGLSQKERQAGPVTASLSSCQKKKGLAKGQTSHILPRVFLHTLHRVVGRAITFMLHDVAQENSFNTPTTWSAVKQLANISKQLQQEQETQLGNPDCDIQIHNDDLAGFFLTPPQARLESDVQWLVERYCRQHARTPLDRAYLTVSAGLPLPTEGYVRRGWLPGCGGHRLPVKLILPVVQHSFHASIFTVVNTVVRQIRGAFISSPLSPPLCNNTVTRSEFEFLVTLNHRRLGWGAARYVDNRICITRVQSGLPSVPAAVLTENFYGEPILLEPEPDTNYLGTMVTAKCGQLQMEFVVYAFNEILQSTRQCDSDPECEPVLNERWRYRSEFTDARTQRCSVDCLLHGAVRLSSPTSLAQLAVLKAFATLLYMQYDRQILEVALSKHSKRFAATYTADMRRTLLSAIQCGGKDGTQQLLKVIRHHQ